MKFIYALIKSPKGFSLAEVLVAAGLFGGLSLAVMHFMQSSTQSSNTVMASMEVTQLHNQVLLHLRDENNCRLTFGNHQFGDNNIPLARALKDGTKDDNFKGLTGDKAQIKLIGIKLYRPDEKPPEVANFDSTFTAPDQDGWTIVAEFKYEKYKSTSAPAKIFGGNNVSKFHLLKFNNFVVDELITNPATCTADPFNVVGQGRDYQLDDGTILFIAPCLKGAPGNVVQSCVIL
ncbi:MAG: hypothetical protein A2X86_19335 [Bdellovibrionales bacterium GWA2_49_15]|nr:MAG: hypothetical protein A2X86_19335 [Bdellovibrionales bacterium GWA2_49_15]HAZ14383.1 hypothetical protein [Bdellovibrionales bacterium]